MHEIGAYTWVSWLHLGSALAAMVLGVTVLLRRKGDRLHVRLGYAYVVCMLLVNATAFGLYRLFGTFGPFHVAALVSLLTLLAGMRIALRRPHKPDWLVHHLTYMYWSVIGLYAAFFSELMVRLPLGATFAWSVGLATGAVILLGFVGQRRLTAHWTKQQATSGIGSQA